MQNVFSDPLFLEIGKATGTYTLQVGNRTVSLLQWQVLQGNSIASEHFFLVFLSPRREASGVSSVTCGEMEGIALPAVSSSSHPPRLHLTIFPLPGSQPARLWASGSTQQRGDYHINLFKYSVWQV